MRKIHGSEGHGKPPALRTTIGVAGAMALLGLLAACGGEGSGGAELRTVQVHESSELEVAADPAGGRLAFTLLGGLWTVPDTGGRASRVTPPDYRVRDPAWAPTGSRVAVVAVEGHAYSLRVVDVETGEARQLVSGAVRLSGPAWSPDGARLAYAAGDRSECDVWVVSLADGDGAAAAEESARDAARRLTELPGCQDSPVWFRDRIVFAQSPGGDGGVPGAEATGADLWAVSAEGGEAAVLLRAPGEQRPVPGLHPAAGAVEEGLLYLSTENGETSLHALSSEGGDTSLASHSASDALLRGLGSDAGRPAALAEPAGAFVVAGEGRLWRADGDGGRSPVPFEAEVEIEAPEYERRTPEIALDAPRPARGIVQPRLSPDGTRVAFSALGDIWVAPLDGSAPPRAVVTGPAEQTMPAWSPDGRELVYASNETGDFDLWVVLLERGELRRLTSLPGDEREPAWDPTGRRIAFSFFDNRTVDLFTVSADGGEPRRLTRHETWHWDISPAWDPDGRRIAFLQRTRSDPVPTVAVADLASGGAVSRLELPDTPVTAVAWSPAGELIYRSAGRLRALAPDASGMPGGPAESLGDARAFQPSFDARGERLLYLSPEGLRLRARAGEEERLITLDLPVEPAPVPPPLTIRGVRLVDGTGAEPRGPVDIRIEEGRIVSIASSEAVDGGGEGERVLDGAGLTALPGLIDMHTHLFHYGVRAYLGAGVTTVRDVGFESHLVASRAEGVLSGRLRGPRIIYAGEFLDGLYSRWMGNFMVVVTEAEEVRREVARLADIGAGWIKTYDRMPPALRRAAIDAAHAHGLPTTQHEIFPATAWGADGKEHVRTGLRQDLRVVLAASGAVVVTTLDTGSGSFVYMRDHPEIWEDEAVTGLIPPFVRASFRASVDGADSATALSRREGYQERLDAVAELREDGVRLVVGTDPTNPHVLFGIGVHWELEHLVQAGLTPLEAIHLATGAAAEALGLEGEIGTVKSGTRADLILVEGDPVTDVRDTRRLRWIVFGGEALRPEALYLDGSGGAQAGPGGARPAATAREGAAPAAGGG